MFYFWYLKFYRYYSKLIKRTQSFLKPVGKLAVFLWGKTTNKIEWKSIGAQLYRKCCTNSTAIALLLFFGLAFNLSMLLNGVSHISFSNLLADSNIIVEAMDLQDPVSTNETVSINDINLDSYDYYQNLNMEAKPENFLDLYLVEDEAFLLRTVDFSDSDIDISSPDKIITYVVKQGDTLEKIAKNFGINVETLKTANSLKKSVISPGQKLIILPISGIYYTVKKGDSLGKLAIKYKISASVIREYNDLEKDTLKINEKIILPGAKEQIIINNVAKSGTKITDTGGSGFFMYPTVGWNWGEAHGIGGCAVDIANTCGTPIYASADGTVIDVRVSGYNAGYGLYIKIQHNNGTSTLYAHLSQILIANGQYVSRGQLIGKMGTTGKSTGCHLHFEVKGAKNPFIKK